MMIWKVGIRFFLETASCSNPGHRYLGNISLCIEAAGQIVAEDELAKKEIKSRREEEGAVLQK